MEKSRRIEFVKKMGKRRLKLNRQMFDAGGTVLEGPGTTTNNVSTPGFGGAVASFVGDNAAGAQIQQGTNTAQLNQAYSGAQQGLGNQNQLVDQLMPQAGNAIANQNALAQQELAISQGRGPNPAQNQLAQATRANVANQASLMAGQRGAGSNPALMARQAAMQGANTQQQASGQAATMGAQQQIQAQQNLAGLSGNQLSQTGQAITGQNTAQQNEQNTLQNANTSANNAAVGMQSNINNINSAAADKGAASVLGAYGGIGNIISKGGVVGDPSLQINNQHISNEKKLEFVHKMTQLGMKHFDDGGEVSDTPKSDLGSSSYSTQSVSDPTGDSFNLDKKAPEKNSGLLAGLGAAMSMSEGGEIEPNPFLTPSQQQSMTSNFGNPGYVSGMSSTGPNVPGTAPLPQGGGGSGSLYKSIKGMMAKDPKDKTKKGDLGLSGDIKDVSSSDTSSFEPDAITEPDVSEISDSFAYGGELHPKFQGPSQNIFENYFSASKGGEVPALVSSGEVYLTPEQVHQVVHKDANPLKIGHKFKGTEKVRGDSIKNDNIAATLTQGGVVIDKEHVMNPEKAALFVHKSIARRKARQ